MAKDVLEVLAAAANGHCEPLPMLDAHDRIAELIAACEARDMARSAALAATKAKLVARRNGCPLDGDRDTYAVAAVADDRYFAALAACRGL